MKSLEKPMEYFRLILASILASIGLMTDNLTAVIASMFLSTLMGSILASSILLSLQGLDDSRSQSLYGIKCILKGVSLVIIASALVASIGRGFVPLQVTSQLSQRASPNLIDFTIAVCAGVIGVQSLIHKGELGALIASALAIALVPPASTVGISVAMMDPAPLSGSLFLLSTNSIALILAGYILARIYMMIQFSLKIMHSL